MAKRELTKAQMRALQFLDDGPCTMSEWTERSTKRVLSGPHGSVVMTSAEALALCPFYEPNIAGRSLFKLTASGRAALSAQEDGRDG